MTDVRAARAETLPPPLFALEKEVEMREAEMREAEMSDTPLLDALRKSRLAVELTDAQCRALAAAMTLRDLGDGDVLVREGAPDDHMYVIDRGRLSIVKHAGAPEAVVLNTLQPGDMSGELSWLDGNPRYASVLATGATRVLGLERARLEALTATDGEIVYRVMRAMMRFVHSVQQQLWMQQSELANYIYKQHGRY
jgi:CRP-like cAMP-binding protein